MIQIQVCHMASQTLFFRCGQYGLYDIAQTSPNSNKMNTVDNMQFVKTHLGKYTK